MPLPLTIFSCAKINLSLDIVGLRHNGYHELRSIVHTIALCDTLSLSFDGSNTWRLLCDDQALQTPDNLCLQAARSWSQAWAKAAGSSEMRHKIEPIGGEISLLKRIPYGAGLGGGSGNAWAVLQALSHAFDHEHEILPLSQLHELAQKLGADVPLFARGGALLIEGIGEHITPLAPLGGWVVLAQPREITSTPASYRAWDLAGVPSGNCTQALLQAWSENHDEADTADRLREIGARLGNDLSVSARALGVPIDDGIAALRQSGAVGAEMTGSGSAVFGLCSGPEHAVEVMARAREILGAPRHASDQWRLWSAPLCDYGTKLEAASGLNACVS